MSKSHVGLEYRICPITGQKWETGSLLLDRRMRDTLEKESVTGWGISPEAQEHLNKGMIAFVGADLEKSAVKGGRVTLESAYRTGAVAYLKREVAIRMAGEDVVGDNDFIFCDQETIEQLNEMMKNIENQ